ncbi:hypothetical protein Agub_g5308 [Astrephomene gubernaculifera]|uniref:Alpha-tubulin N-acetyltransferase n=1 Tax=Astrephomene gubernaculifera TaxID=47775 RepID=A0AAD3DPC7_9CHLO|nr:hypothetical protein Agub_g5308 [Astrephomene gubernaculifera]
MEFDFTSLAFGGEQHIVAWDAKRIASLKPDDLKNLGELISCFGKKSAVAQGLQTPVTDIHRLRTTDQRLYLYMYRQSSKTVVLGGLKVGSKRLYVRTITADLREIEPVCVLDFYVHESCQRRGVGKELFEYFLESEGCDPGSVAYDRPSPKLLEFLKKHYGLKDYVPQSNNYVVFNRYFELNPPLPGGSRAGSTQGGRSSSRGSASSICTPHVHPLHGPRAAPLVPQGPPASPPVSQPGWGASNAPTGVLPTTIGQSPSFGHRWASSTFGCAAAAAPPPFPAQPPLGEPSGGAFGEEASYSVGDSLDEFSRAHLGQQQQQQPPPSYPPQPRWQAGAWESNNRGAAGQQPQPFPASSSSGPKGPPPAFPAMGPSGLGAPPPFPAAAASAHGAPPPFATDVPGPSGAPPPGSRGNYTFRPPPWAVDETPSASGPVASSSSGGLGQPMPMPYGSSPARAPQVERLGGTPVRGPLHGILGGGMGGGSGGGSSATGPGPHTRALQEQVAALSVSGGAAMQGNAEGGHVPPLQLAGGGGGAAGGAKGVAGAEDPALSSRSAARIMAVAQRSGAGAADCLVW